MRMRCAHHCFPVPLLIVGMPGFPVLLIFLFAVASSGLRIGPLWYSEVYKPAKEPSGLFRLVISRSPRTPVLGYLCCETYAPESWPRARTTGPTPRCVGCAKRLSSRLVPRPCFVGSSCVPMSVPSVSGSLVQVKDFDRYLASVGRRSSSLLS